MAGITKTKENPIFDPSQPYIWVQRPPERDFYLQNDCCYGFDRKFIYSLETELPLDKIANNNGYKVEILDPPIPFEIEKNVVCPVCGYRSGTRMKVSRHCDAVHGKHLAVIEREMKIYLQNGKRR